MFPFRDMNHCRVTCIYGKPGEHWKSGKHEGIDLVSDGNKDILSVSQGTVIRSGWNDSWGQYIVTELRDGRAIVYAHLSKRYVYVGSSVREGQLIGIMGSTGNSSGPHLHIELQRKYYQFNVTDDIAKYLGIENQLGVVKLLDKVPQWQIDATEAVCDRYKFTNKEDWVKKVKEGKTLTVGELFGILNKVV